jgi:GxxExxY protein
VPVSFWYRDARIDNAYRMDFVVETRVIVEVKAVSKLLPVHDAQLLTYLQLSGLKVGLLLNFHEPTLRRGVRRLVLNAET